MHDHLFLLDAGHGINTPGKRSPVWDDDSQFFEWEFTRDIVARLMEWGPRFGLDCLPVVTVDDDIPLSTRVNIANAYHNHKKKPVFISIHANAGGGHGVEVFTSPGQTASDIAADIFYNKYASVFPDVRMRSDMSDGDADKEANFYVLTHTLMPAVLTENFFMDNERECREILMTEKGRADIAQVHLAAMVEINMNGLEG